MDKKIVFALIISVVIILGAIFYFTPGGKAPTTLGGPEGGGPAPVAFAQCLSDKGVKMYGAWWCPHCAHQKELFGQKAFAKVDYVECEKKPRGAGQTAVCKKEGIEGYPTWIFGDGERVASVLSLEALSEKTSCPLPEGESDSADETGDVGTGSTSEATEGTSTEVASTTDEETASEASATESES